MSAGLCMSSVCLLDHGKLQPEPLGAFDGGFISGIGVTHDARTAVVDQNPFESLGRRVAAVGHNDHAGMLRITHSNSTAVVEGNPACSARGIEQSVEQGPVRDRVGAVAHRFRFAVGAGYRAGVEVVAANHDWSLELAVANHFVEGKACNVAFAQTQPAYARGQALESDAVAGHIQPADNRFVFGEKLFDLGVGFIDVLGVAGQCYPAEGALAFTEQRTDVGGHESREIEGVGHAGIGGNLSDIVAVVDSGNAHRVEVEHGFDMNGARFACALGQFSAFRGV